METEKLIIMPESPEAATLVTVEAWRSRKGNYWIHPDHAEETARRDGATHKYCAGECGALVPANSYYKCSDCLHKDAVEKHSKAERREVTSEEMLYSDSHDKHFDNAGEVYEYLEEFEQAEGNGTTVEDLLLYICEPQYAHSCELDSEFFERILADSDDFPDELQEAIDTFNAAVKAYEKPLSWYPSKVAAILEPKE